MNCQACNIGCMKFGKHRNGLRRFRCGKCGKTYTEDHTRLFGDMIASEEKALLAIQLLLEGTSVRSASRITQLSRDTILRLLVLARERCERVMNEKMRDLECQRIQADELWSFVGKKQKRVRKDDSPELGDAFGQRPEVQRLSWELCKCYSSDRVRPRAGR